MAALAVGVAWLSGCSFLQTHHYYAPSAPGAEAEQDVLSRCEWIGGFRLSGPPNRLLLESGDVVLGVFAYPYQVTTWTAGPLVFPILPALPPSLFRQERREPGDAVTLTFRILEPRSVDVDFRSVTVRVSGGGEAGAGGGEPLSYAADRIVESFVPFEREQPEWELTDGFRLDYVPSSEADEPFAIEIEGIVYRGEVLVFPRISFEPARGFTVCQNF